MKRPGPPAKNHDNPRPARFPAFLKSLLTLLKFSFVGLLNTGIDYGLFLLLDFAGLPYLAAHVLSYTAGLVNSFLWNKFWTFRAARVFSFTETVRFVLVNLAALSVAGGILVLCVRVFALPDFAAKAIALPFSFAVNFLGNRFWVFPAAGPAGRTVDGERPAGRREEDDGR